MNSYDFELTQQFTQIKDAEGVWNKTQEVQEENGVSPEKVEGCVYSEDARVLHPISFGRVPEGGGDDDTTQSSGEGGKHLALLKTIHWKMEESDFQGAYPAQQHCVVDTVIPQEASILQPTETISPNESVQENSEDDWTISLLEGPYIIHEMEVMYVNNPKEAQVPNEEKRSTKKAPDVLWIKVAVPLD